jgi:hypothetical protein
MWRAKSSHHNRIVILSDERSEESKDLRLSFVSASGTSSEESVGDESASPTPDPGHPLFIPEAQP